MKPENIKALHDLAEESILDWLNDPPEDRRQVQALILLAEAGQNLYAACINLDQILVRENSTYDGY